MALVTAVALTALSGLLALGAAYGAPGGGGRPDTGPSTTAAAPSTTETVQNGNGNGSPSDSATPSVSATPDPTPSVAKVDICHATGSTSNPYITNTVDTQSVDEDGNKYLDGHGKHTGPVFDPALGKDQKDWGDIIPPFTSPHGSVYGGMNWPEGQAFWAAGCQAPLPSPTPTETGSPSPTPTPTETGSPSPTPTPTETGSPSPTPTPTETGSPSPTPTPTETGSPSPTPTPTSTGGTTGGTTTTTTTTTTTPLPATVEEPTAVVVPPLPATVEEPTRVIVPPQAATIPEKVNAGGGSSAPDGSAPTWALALMAVSGIGAAGAGLRLATTHRDHIL